MSGATPTFSWKRGFLHAGLSALAVLIIAAGGAAAADVADPQAAGQASAPLVLLAFGIALGISWLFQTGRRTAGWLSLGGVLVAVGVAIALAAIALGGPRLRGPHRLPLQVVEAETGKRVEHPLLGFSVAHPGEGFEPADAIAETLTKKDPAAHAWGWLNQDDGAMFVVAVFAGLGEGDRGAAGLHSFLDGLSRSSSLLDSEREITWTPSVKTFRQSGTVRSVRFVATGEAGELGREGLFACVVVMSMGGDPAAMDAVHASLRL